MTMITLSDKYILLQAENARLKRQLGKAMYYWKEKALFFQAERDYYCERERGSNERSRMQQL